MPQEKCISRSGIFPLESTIWCTDPISANGLIYYYSYLLVKGVLTFPVPLLGSNYVFFSLRITNCCFLSYFFVAKTISHLPFAV